MKTTLNKKTALWTVFLVVLVDLMGFGIVLPLLPFYAAQFDAGPVVIGLLYSVYSFAQLIFSPLWGGWSDRIGRRPIMLMSTLGSTLSYVLFAFSPSLALLFLSRLLAGVMGGNISAAQAYVADVTSAENRSKGMGMIGAAFGIGFVLGPAISSLLLMLPESFFGAGNKFVVPGVAAALLSLTSFILVWLKLPETVQESAPNDPARIRRISVFSPAFWGSLSMGKSGTLPLFFLSAVILSAGQSSLYSAFPLYCKTILSLAPERVGLLFVWMGLVAVLVQGGAIHPLAKRFGEKRLFLLGNILLAAGLALIPFAAGERGLMGALGIMGLGASLNGPTLVSLISKTAAPNEMGRTLGTSQGLSALGRVFGPAWGGLLFAFSPKTPFLFTAGLVSITVWVGFRIHDRG
jgi:MFS family permease